MYQINSEGAAELQDAFKLRFVECSAVVGLLYPMYQSFKAIEAPPPTQHRDEEQWLTYWGVNGALSLAERLLKTRGCGSYLFTARGVYGSRI